PCRLGALLLRLPFSAFFPLSLLLGDRSSLVFSRFAFSFRPPLRCLLLPVRLRLCCLRLACSASSSIIPGCLC
ncbi:hypothetical protein TGDOM2_260205B, partial [Toxoplasma gondii GAB2-2007-GAL-DOM2]